MGFLDSINKIKLSDVESTLKDALNKGYNAHVVINGEMYLINKGVE